MVNSEPKVLMLLSNAYKPDPRVQREAYGLVAHGYEVTVLCWDRLGERAASETDQGVDIRRVQDVITGYGRGWRQLRYFPAFWRRCSAIAEQVSPDFIHCHDLDTLYAGWRIKRRSGQPLIYDAHEHYPAMMSLYLPRLMVWGLAQWERWLLKKADAIVTASSVLKDEFEAAGLSDVVVLGNYPSLADFDNVAVEEVAAERRRLDVDDGKLAVGYVGGFTLNRLFEPLLTAAEQLPDVQFHLWGDGPQRRLIEEASAQRDNITYHGWLDYERLPAVFKALDIIYYALRQDYPGAIYNAPNTLAQSMAAGRPIIATEVGDLGRMVRQANCGVMLQDTRAEEVVAAVNSLRDVEKRRQLGEHGKRAASSSYNAATMQRGLVEVYERLRQEGMVKSVE